MLYSRLSSQVNIVEYIKKIFYGYVKHFLNIPRVTYKESPLVYANKFSSIVFLDWNNKTELMPFVLKFLWKKAYKLITFGLLKELQNYYRKLFLCPPQRYAKAQPVIWTAIFHDKFTLWDIKLTIYIKKQFNSHKKYVFYLLFSENPKKTRTDHSTLQVFYSV